MSKGLFSKVKDTKVSTNAKRTNISAKCGSFLAVIDRGKLGKADEGEGQAFAVLETTVIAQLGETNATVGEGLQEFAQKTGKYTFFEETCKTYAALYAGVDANAEVDENGNDLTDEWWEEKITDVFGTFDEEGKPVVSEDTNVFKGAVLQFNCVPKMDKDTGEQSKDRKGNLMHYVNCQGALEPGDEKLTAEILQKFEGKLAPIYAKQA